jgi:hypothetical protein
MVNSEVDELLHTMRAERRQENLTASSSVELPRIMSKEDCMTLFNATGVPPPGALWGVYRWAANLGEARFNFEREDDNAFLDAYD